MKIHSKFLWLAIVPVMVVFSAELILVLFANSSVSLSGGQIADADFKSFGSASEAASRLRFLALMFASNVYSVCVIYYFWREQSKLFDVRLQKKFCRLFLILSLIPLTIIAFAYWNFIPRSNSLLGTTTFDAAFRLVTPETSKIPFNVETFWWLKNFSGLLAGLAISAIIVNAISCLAELDSTEKEELKLHWKMQSERFQLTVYVATGLLVIGIIYIQNWTTWPSFLFAESVKDRPNLAANAFYGLQTSYIVFSGIEYSLLLASIALPVAFALNEGANKIAEANLLPEGRTVQKILSERVSQGLVVSFQDQLKAILAIIAPFLAGTLGNLVSFLSAKI